MHIIGIAAPVRHALQALGMLAAQPFGSLRVEQMASRLGLPAAALSKCLQRLARKGLLKARRGPGGGYRLAVDARSVTLAAVASALDEGGGRRGRCLLSDKACQGEGPCLLHHGAIEAEAGLRRALERLTLADLTA